MKYDVVVVAGGKGLRADLGYNKALFLMSNNKTVLENSCEIFFNDTDCEKVIIVINDEIDFTNDKLLITNGGNERRDSVLNGLNLTTSEYVLIHDAARPYLHEESLRKLKEELSNKDAVILARKASDTIKVVEDGKITKTLDRNTIYMAETPQAFKTKLIKRCYKECADINFTDDASLVESLGYDVYVINDEFDNKKLTSKEDFKNI